MLQINGRALRSIDHTTVEALQAGHEKITQSFGSGNVYNAESTKQAFLVPAMLLQPKLSTGTMAV